MLFGSGKGMADPFPAQILECPDFPGIWGSANTDGELSRINRRRIVTEKPISITGDIIMNNIIMNLTMTGSPNYKLT